MKLFCITGIDGTGKTTLAQGVTTALRTEGVDAAYVYGRTLPVTSRFLMWVGRATMLRRQNQWTDYAGYTSEKKSVMRNTWLARIYTATILFDYYVQILAKLAPHMWAGRTVISDRYVYDTVISDLTVHLGYSEQDTDRAIHWCSTFLPHPCLTLLLDADPDVAFSRKDDMPHVDYLRERHHWYARLSKRDDVFEIDGMMPREQVLRAALDAIRAKLGRTMEASPRGE
jgi:thymidylate kinase